MSSANCKAKTKSGEKCKLKANSSGYCHIHEPERFSEGEVRQQLPEMFKVEFSSNTFSQRRGLKATLGEALKVLEVSNKLHPALKIHS
ncbi:DUF5763 domain-containing protein [Nostoc sp.]|uniref:DUF5763 domain-containing protein n=1 Tax=Nostoc sp. TaxID=1180 RepID=UPI002FF4FB5A